MPEPIRPIPTLWSGPQPIAEAPVQPGQRFGPCLLAPGIAGDDWVIGYWDGEWWFNEGGDYRLDPQVFLLLPPLDTLWTAPVAALEGPTTRERR